MSDAPVKVVIDCSTAGPPDPSIADEFRQAALAQIEAGDLDKAAALMQEAKDVVAASQVATATQVPLTDDELAQLAAVQQEAADQQAADTMRAWVELRMKRDRWLAQTDAFMVDPLPVDFPADKAAAIQSNLAAWKTFRQELRDLPANTTDPAAPTWPTPPGQPVVYLT